MVFIGKTNINYADYIILPKENNLRQSVEKLIEDYNIDTEKIIIRRGSDMSMFIDELYQRTGQVAIGFTGSDLLANYDLGYSEDKVKILGVSNDWISKEEKELKFDEPNLCLIGEGSLEGILLETKGTLTIGIPEKYEAIAKQYCEYRFPNREIEYLSFKGGVEENIQLGLYPLAIDIVETGKTTQESGLQILDRIFSSRITMIGPNTGGEKTI